MLGEASGLCTLRICAQRRGGRPRGRALEAETEDERVKHLAQSEYVDGQRREEQEPAQPQSQPQPQPEPVDEPEPLKAPGDAKAAAISEAAQAVERRFMNRLRGVVIDEELAGPELSAQFREMQGKQPSARPLFTSLSAKEQMKELYRLAKQAAAGSDHDQAASTLQQIDRAPAAQGVQTKLEGTGEGSPDPPLFDLSKESRSAELAELFTEWRPRPDVEPANVLRVPKFIAESLSGMISS
eukprot:tig00021623_g23010.t1